VIKRLRRIGSMCVLAIALASAANGQTAAAAAAEPRFADMPWGSSVDVVHKTLTGLGMTMVKKSEEGDAQYFGRLFDEEAVVITSIAPGKGLAKVQVGLVPAGKSAVTLYRSIVATLTPKYGTPEDTETYVAPYSKGDGFQDLAIKAGKATFESLWDRKTPYTAGLLVSISQSMAVTLTYESAAWPAESERRAKKARSVF
jgi:hypothetical protein